MAEDYNIDCRTPDTLKANKEEYEYLKKLDARFGNCCSLWSNNTQRIFKLAKKVL